MFQFHITVWIPILIILAVGSASIAIYLSITQNKLEMLYQGTTQKSFREQWGEISIIVRRKMPQSMRYLFNPQNTEELLNAAGMPYNLTSEEFLSLRMLAFGVAVVAMLTALISKFILISVGILIIKLPDWWLQYLISERRKKMDREFFVVASRLAAALAGGLPLDKALEWASRQASLKKEGYKEKKPSPLRVELKRCIKEVELGKSLEIIFNDFAERTGLLSAKRMVLAILQAKKGVPVADSLQESVNDARERRKQMIIGQARSAEKKAEIALFLMAIPVLLLILAPMAITYMQQGFLE